MGIYVFAKDVTTRKGQWNLSKIQVRIRDISIYINYSFYTQQFYINSIVFKKILRLGFFFQNMI